MLIRRWEALRRALVVRRGLWWGEALGRALLIGRREALRRTLVVRRGLRRRKTLRRALMLRRLLWGLPALRIALPT